MGYLSNFFPLKNVNSEEPFSESKLIINILLMRILAKAVEALDLKGL